MARDPFKAIASGGGNGSPPPDPGHFVSPIPADAPAAPVIHPKRGKPNAAWTYRDDKGGVIGFVWRFDAPDGGKDVIPVTLWREDGRLVWRWKAPPAPRALYGLDRLASRPEAPVLVVEGEKAADAAQVLFPDLVVITWPGGANAVGKTDFSPLRGRVVALWPDADDAGDKAMKAAMAAALKAVALSAQIVELPKGFPKGWDLADDLPPGLTLAEVRSLIEAALSGSAHGGDVESQMTADGSGLPYGFRLDTDGLWFDRPIEGGVKPDWVSGSFEILGEARDSDGAGWSVVIRFMDSDHKQKTEIVSKSKLATAPNEVRAHLIDLGLRMKRRAPNTGDPFADALLGLVSPKRITLCKATGWQGANLFVLPNEVMGPEGAEPAMFSGSAAGLRYGKSGEFDKWKAEIGAAALGNSRLLVALSAAFAGPLLMPLSFEGGGIHFKGGSSCGKTSLAMAAGSVWGGSTSSLGYSHAWRATGNALESLAYAHSHTLLSLDEIGLLAPEDAGNAVYGLANGQAKARLKSDSSMRARPEWYVSIISTGEISLADHIASSRKAERIMAGMELRMIDLAAWAGREMGAWEDIHGAISAAAFSDALKVSAGLHYGHAGPAFVQALIENGDAALAAARAVIKRFQVEAVKESDTGQIRRAALRFGLLAAAGELAAEFGVVPWPERAAFAAVLRMFNEWAAGFGRSILREDAEILRRLSDTLQTNLARFSRMDEEDGEHSVEARALQTLGYRTHHLGEGGFFFIHSAGWREIFAGFDQARAARLLQEKGFLVAEGDGRLQKKKSVKGQKLNLYHVKASILGYSADDAAGS